VKYSIVFVLTILSVGCAEMFSDYNTETAHFVALNQSVSLGEEVTVHIDDSNKFRLAEKFLPNNLPIEFRLEIKVAKPITRNNNWNNNWNNIGPSSEDRIVILSVYFRVVTSRGTVHTVAVPNCRAGAKFTTRLFYRSATSVSCEESGPRR